MSGNGKRSKGPKARGRQWGASSGDGGGERVVVMTEAEAARRRSMALFAELLKDKPDDGTSTSAAPPAATTKGEDEQRPQQRPAAAGEEGHVDVSRSTALMLEELGIGGLDVQVKTLLRRALASRLMAPELATKLKVKHIRGILLHGPPGTGKTLIARQLGRLLNSREPKLIAGPELLSMWVGKSEENLRKVFEEAEREFAEKGKDSGLHLVIFDEIDALSRKRGSLRDSSGVMDSCVNQLLSKIDGLVDNDNVLVIGTTNRKDLLDDALLRPGRLEVHVEVGLPDLSGREQVFRVHTATLRQHGALGQDVDLWELARRTQNFTGAEIEGVVKSALSFALQRQISTSSGQQQQEEAGGAVMPVVGMLDLLRGLKEAKPHYAAAGGSARELEARHLPLGLLPFRPEVPRLLHTATAAVLAHAAAIKAAFGSSGGFASKPGAHGRSAGVVGQQQQHLPVLCLLLRGPRGSGKTAVLARLASLCASAYTFRRLLRSSDHDLQGGQHDDASACEALGQVLLDAHQCPSSLLLLDDLEALAHYTTCTAHHRDARVSPARLHTLLAMLGGRLPPEGRVCCVVASSSLSEEALRGLGLWQCFGLVLELPMLHSLHHARTLLLGLAQQRRPAQEAGDDGDALAPPPHLLDAIQCRLPLAVREVLQLAALHPHSSATAKHDPHDSDKQADDHTCNQCQDTH